MKKRAGRAGRGMISEETNVTLQNATAAVEAVLCTVLTVLWYLCERMLIFTSVRYFSTRGAFTRAVSNNGKQYCQVSNKAKIYFTHRYQTNIMSPTYGVHTRPPRDSARPLLFLTLLPRKLYIVTKCERRAAPQQVEGPRSSGSATLQYLRSTSYKRLINPNT